MVCEAGLARRRVGNCEVADLADLAPGSVGVRPVVRPVSRRDTRFTGSAAGIANYQTVSDCCFYPIEEGAAHRYIFEGVGWWVRERPVDRVSGNCAVDNDLGYLSPRHPLIRPVCAVAISGEQTHVPACLDVVVEGGARDHVCEVRPACCVDRELEAEHYYLGKLSPGCVVGGLEAILAGCGAWGHCIVARYYGMTIEERDVRVEFVCR
jgi:hypothetical protein